MSAGGDTGVSARRGLFAKYVGGMIAVVTLVLVVNGLIDVWFSYRSARESLESIQREKAVAAAERVEQFVTEIERHIGWTTQAQWATGPVEQRRYDFIRLMNQVKAITEVVQIDGAGREQLKVSRLSMDVVGSQADWTQDARFKGIQDKPVRFSPVYLRKESEPYMSVSVARKGRRTGATVAEVNLKLILDVLIAIKVGKAGYAYVVDREGKLIAHPDISLVLRNTDMARLDHVRTALAVETRQRDAEAARRAAALAAASGNEAEVKRLAEEEARGAVAQMRDSDALPAVIGSNLAGKTVLSAAAPIQALGWLVFVELPLQEALQPLYTSLIQTGLLLVLGLALAAGAAGVLARRMMVPIRALGVGAARLGGGDLGHRIEVKSGDEIEALAGGFNRMAEQLQESYAGLEQKVEARTQELARSVDELTASGEILRLIAATPDDLQPMFQSILEHGTRLCEANFGTFWMFKGEVARAVAIRGAPIAYEAFLTRAPVPVGPDTNMGQVRRTGVARQVEDVRATPAYAAGDPVPRAGVDLGGVRTLLTVPLARQGEVIGALAIYRQEVRPFSDKQVSLLTTFADQAIIAIENSRLLRELRSRTSELARSVEELTASGEILRMIAASPEDLEPMFQTILEHATRLCEASFGFLFMIEGDVARPVAMRDVPPALAAYFSQEPMRPGPGTAIGRVISSLAPVHIEDARADAAYAAGDPLRRATVDLGGFRTLLGVPMIRQGDLIGVFMIFRQEVRSFSDQQLKLLTTFADQAVIAIENSRLLRELRARTQELGRSVEELTASGEILRLIASTPDDLEPMFQSILAHATRLCDAHFGYIWMVEGDEARVVAMRDVPPPLADFLNQGPIRPGPDTVYSRTIRSRAPVQVEDVRAEPAYVYGDPQRRASVELGGIRTLLGVPMIRQGEVIGVFGIYRQEVRAFSDKQMKLVTTFADQAVIAIENSRLLRELRARTQELGRSVEELTASGEILRLIAATPDDLQPMFKSILEHGTRLCEASFGVLRIVEGDIARPVAMYNIPQALSAYLERQVQLGPDTTVGRAMRSLEPAQTEDARTSAAYLAGEPMRRALVDLGGMRSVLVVPMIRQGELVGTLSIFRQEIGRFTDKQVKLMSTFADQAVIAIENSRLLRELRSRTDELSESLEYQTATSDVLKVISGSAFNLEPVLQTVAETAASLCHADEAALFLREGDAYRWAASVHINSAYVNAVRGEVFAPGRDSLIGRTALEGTVVQIEDALADPEYSRKDLARLGGMRTLLGVPLVRDGTMTGVMVLTRRHVEAFTDKQVEVLQVFADQAVIAVENVRLFTEIQEKSRQLELASQHKSQFLANMSHELRTPLNAVLGYAELLLDGIYGELPARAHGVLERVQSNGKHLLGLINDVLDLSKIEAGQLRLALDAYALPSVVRTVIAATESLANAKNLSLKATIADGLPTGIGDERRLTQVLLNLVGNAIKFTDEGGVEIAARATDGRFEISVSDTGPGIAPEDQARIFEEFHQVDNTSTRKKGGTGLGLAISLRIVALHGGALTIESELGRGSTFRVTLPVKVEKQQEAA